MLGEIIGYRLERTIGDLKSLSRKKGIKVWMKPIPAKYLEGGRERYIVYSIAVEDKLGSGPTLLIAGDVDEESAKKIAENMIHGAASKYRDIYLSFDSVKKKIEEGKFRELENRIKEPDKGYEELYVYGRDIIALMRNSKGFRKALYNNFKGRGINYKKDLDRALPGLPKAENFKGEYLWKFEEVVRRFMKEEKNVYVLPVEGLARVWKRVVYIDLSESEEFMNFVKKMYNLLNKTESMKDMSKEDMKRFNDYMEKMRKYLKGVLESGYPGRF